MCLCVSWSVRTVCTAVTQAINFVTNPRAKAPAQYKVERATLHIYTYIYIHNYIHTVDVNKMFTKSFTEHVSISDQ